MHLVLITTLMDTVPAGILELLKPVLKYFANKAKRKGIEKELPGKYYYE